MLADSSFFFGCLMLADCSGASGELVLRASLALTFAFVLFELAGLLWPRRWLGILLWLRSKGLREEWSGDGTAEEAVI